MSQPGLLPSSFLPFLPKSQGTISPLSAVDLLAHIAVLKELYIPPIHGGFDASELDAIAVDSEDEDATRTSRIRRRRFSAGLAETIDGFGKGLDLNIDPGQSIPENGELHLHDLDTSSEEDETPVEGDHSPEYDVVAPHLDPFERDWAEKWLNGLVRRLQGWIEEKEDSDGPDEDGVSLQDIEMLLRDATAVLAMMAGTSAAGSLTRHLLFPVHPSLAPYVKRYNQTTSRGLTLSPETSKFLASLSTSPTSPTIPFYRSTETSQSPPRGGRRRASSATRSTFTDLSTSPTTAFTFSATPSNQPSKRRRPVIPILLHDAPMADHLSVGVQTWGSSILLSKAMALHPRRYGLLPPPSQPRKSMRILELGAGTGLLSVVCRKLLTLYNASQDIHPTSPAEDHLVVATDFHPDVLNNLKVCLDLNFPPQPATSDVDEIAPIVEVAKLDWTTFPALIAQRKEHNGTVNKGQNELPALFDEPFDLVLASDCVYDSTHARMLREVVSWVLRPPNPSDTDDHGGAFHILSPLRPTFTPELESIDIYFPSFSTTPSTRDTIESADGVAPARSPGEGIGSSQGLKLACRGDGKRSVRGRKGEGRVDEVKGYWWWEVGWTT